MKNSFKIAALALVIATSFAACKGKTDETTTDTVTKVDTTTIAVDSTVTVDSTVVDTTTKM